MGVIAFSALAQGLLTDRYLDGVPADSRAARSGSTLPGDHLDEATLIARLAALLADADIAVASDGGGKITAARKVITGLGKVVRLFMLAVAGHSDRITREMREINGEPGIVEYYDGHPFAVNTFTSENGRITAIYRVMNPDKLKALEK